MNKLRPAACMPAYSSVYTKAAWFKYYLMHRPIRLTTLNAVNHLCYSGEVRSKYALAKLLSLSPIMIDKYLTGTRMGKRVASIVLAKWNIDITDKYTTGRW